MQILITYDLDGFHTPVKALACRSGFTDKVWLDNGALVPLPNTTLHGDFPSLKEAVDTFVRIAQTAAPFVRIEKVLACPGFAGYLLGSR